MKENNFGYEEALFFLKNFICGKFEHNDDYDVEMILQRQNRHFLTKYSISIYSAISMLYFAHAGQGQLSFLLKTIKLKIQSPKTNGCIIQWIDWYKTSNTFCKLAKTHYFLIATLCRPLLNIMTIDFSKAPYC